MQEIFDVTGEGPQPRTADNITRVDVDTLNEIAYFTREDITHTGTLNPQAISLTLRKRIFSALPRLASCWTKTQHLANTFTIP